MLKNLSLGMKLALGFGSLILLTLLVGILAVFGINSVIPKTNQLSDEYMPLVEKANSLQTAYANTRVTLDEYFLDNEPELLQQTRNEAAAVETLIAELEAYVAENENLSSLSEDIQNIRTNFEKFKTELDTAESIFNEIESSKKVLQTTSDRFLKNLAGFIDTIKQSTSRGAGGTISAAQLDDFANQISVVNEITRLGNEARTGAWRLLAERDQSVVAEINRNFGTISTRLEDLQAQMGSANAMKFTMTQAAVTAFQSAVGNVVSNWEQLDTVSAEIISVSEEVQSASQSLVTAGIDQTKEISIETTAVISQISLINIIGLAAVLAIGIFTAFSISRGLTKSINEVIEGLNRGAEQVTVTAKQVDSASTELASGASHQASSVEEVSASLEEMSSMTVQNADNAKQANALAQEARESAEDGNRVMEKMSGAIHDIKDSADETAKIIKNIDEIAFQTNLLALNAAVEAARAGEAGKGFAVVAEEVRNLAQRSAAAAKDTSELIIQSQENSKNGVKVSEEVAAILSRIVDNSNKVSALLGEVATASDEQSTGIQQISSAVASMDKIIQKNASHAEESSSSSAMLKEQAEELNMLIGTLVELVEGKNGAHVQTSGELEESYEDEEEAPRPERRLPSRNEPSVPRAAVPAQKRNMELDPDKVIPLDDEDLTDF